jgi:hypothetical protein
VRNRTDRSWETDSRTELTRQGLRPNQIVTFPPDILPAGAPETRMSRVLRRSVLIGSPQWRQHLAHSKTTFWMPCRSPNASGYSSF